MPSPAPSNEPAVPVQPVEKPILCAPYQEPDQHWLYDTRTGIPSKIPGRRPASYWFKTERTGAAQRDLFAEEERDDLPLVNALREDVQRWRESGWENASETTKTLPRHWSREDRGRRLFFCQVEAVETIIYLREILAVGKRPRWTPRLTLEDFETLTGGRTRARGSGWRRWPSTRSWRTCRTSRACGRSRATPARWRRAAARRW